MTLNRQLYLTGKIRVYETQLFGRGEFSRFTENKNTQAFLRELKDTRYGRHLKDDGLEGAASRYIKKMYLELNKDMGADAIILDAFMTSHRAAEYIGLLKKRAAETGEKRIVSVPSDSPAAVKKAVKKLGSSEDLSDREIEKAFMDAASQLYLNKFSSPKLKQLWRDHIDIKNFLNNIRHTRPGLYFEGGHIDLSFWDYSDCRREIPAKLRARAFMKAVSSDDSPENYERRLEDWMAGRLRELRKITFGPEPVCAFFLTLITEARNLAAVYTGLQMGLAARDIRENLFYSYV